MNTGIACSLTQKDVNPHTEIQAAVNFKRSPSWSILEKEIGASCLRFLDLDWSNGHLHNPLAICQVVKEFFTTRPNQQSPTISNLNWPSKTWWIGCGTSPHPGRFIHRMTKSHTGTKKVTSCSQPPKPKSRPLKYPKCYSHTCVFNLVPLGMVKS